MTDRTEEFRGAVKVFSPAVTVVKDSSQAAAASRAHDLGYQKTSEFLQLASSVAVAFEGTSKLVGIPSSCVAVENGVGWLRSSGRLAEREGVHAVFV